MSEWIDFTLYSVQIVLLWALLPRQSAQYTVPAIVDRDPDWPAKHPAVMQGVLRSRAFLNMFYVYAAVSIAVLLALRLGFKIPVLSGTAQAPSWEILKDAHGTFLIVGLIMYFGSYYFWRHWLTTHVPLAPRRSASLKPRLASDYLPRSWRIATEVLTVAHIGVWLVVGTLGFASGAKFWWSFAFIVCMTVLFGCIAHLVPKRRPGYFDRVFGEAYRHVELKIAYFMRLWPLAAGAIGLAELTTGVELARAGYLLIVSLVCVVALMILRLQPAAPASGGTRGYGAFVSDPKSPACTLRE
jgi:hypothetical protein